MQYLLIYSLCNIQHNVASMLIFTFIFSLLEISSELLMLPGDITNTHRDGVGTTVYKSMTASMEALRIFG